jgi:hypothetical protein
MSLASLTHFERQFDRFVPVVLVALGLMVATAMVGLA